MPIRFVSDRLKQLHCRVSELLAWAEQEGVKQTMGYSLAYLEGRDPFRDEATEAHMAPLLDFLRCHLEQDARLLEVGAGTGRFTIPLARAGFRVDALEPAATGLETIEKKARKLGLDDRVRCLCGSYENLADLGANVYDGCLALQSIMYCDGLGSVRQRVRDLAALARSVLVFDLVSKYGYVLAGAPDVPATAQNIRSIYEDARMPGEDTHRKERLCFATYDQAVELAASTPLKSPKVIPVSYDMVLKSRLPAAEAMVVEEFFREDPKMREMSMFILVMAETCSRPGDAKGRSMLAASNIH